MARIYDPLGLVAPVTIKGKFIYRDVCNEKVAWDAPLPPPLASNGHDGRKSYQPRSW